MAAVLLNENDFCHQPDFANQHYEKFKFEEFVFFIQNFFQDKNTCYSLFFFLYRKFGH